MQLPKILTLIQKLVEAFMKKDTVCYSEIVANNQKQNNISSLYSIFDQQEKIELFHLDQKYIAATGGTEERLGKMVEQDTELNLSHV